MKPKPSEGSSKKNWGPNSRNYGPNYSDSWDYNVGGRVPNSQSPYHHPTAHGPEAALNSNTRKKKK